MIINVKHWVNYHNDLSWGEKMKNVVVRYTLGEELINSISHGLAAGLAIAGMVLLIIQSHNAMGIVTSVIYTSILFIMYTISCIYHALSPKLKGKEVLRNIDHSNVLLMVAGTYTPIALCLLKGWIGWSVFTVVWCITITAVVFNSIDVDKYQKVCLASNLILGWASLLILHQLMNSTTTEGLLLLFGGGIVYTIGAILYVLGSKIRYIHSLFHFFVIVASILHYFFIFYYVV